MVFKITIRKPPPPREHIVYRVIWVMPDGRLEAKQLKKQCDYLTQFKGLIFTIVYLEETYVGSHSIVRINLLGMDEDPAWSPQGIQDVSFDFRDYLGKN